MGTVDTRGFDIVQLTWCFIGRMTCALIWAWTGGTVRRSPVKWIAKVTGATRVTMIATRVMLAATGTRHFVTRLPGVLVTAASFTRLVRVGLARAKGVPALTGATIRGSCAPGATCLDVIGRWPV